MSRSIRRKRVVGWFDLEKGSRVPLRPLPLVASVTVITAAAALLSAGAAALTLLVILPRLSGESAHVYLLELRFDLPLKARLGAAAISTLYLSLAVATVGASAVFGGRAWYTLIAAGPVRARGWSLVVWSAATLAYAAVASLTLIQLQPQHVIVDGPTDFVLLGVIVANLGCLAPLAEELFFRGWLYTALRANFGVRPAFLATAAAFAIFHFDWRHRHMLLVLPLALALGLVRERTGSIRPTIALHAIYNLITIAITLVTT